MAYVPAKDIRFKNHSGKRSLHDGGPVYQGRNGLGIQTGIQVRGDGWGYLQLTPLSSKGPANGYLTVPPEEVDALIAALQEAKATHES